jgi:hypothetical protein
MDEKAGSSRSPRRGADRDEGEQLPPHRRIWVAVMGLAWAGTIVFLLRASPSWRQPSVALGRAQVMAGALGGRSRAGGRRESCS